MFLLFECRFACHHRTIVASEGFAGICAGGWADLGEFPIAGFAKAERVYGLADETPAG